MQRRTTRVQLLLAALVFACTARAPQTGQTPEAKRIARDAHERLAASVRDGRLIVAEESGHMINEAQPDLIIERMRIGNPNAISGRHGEMLAPIMAS